MLATMKPWDQRETEEGGSGCSRGPQPPGAGPHSRRRAAGERSSVCICSRSRHQRHHLVGARGPRDRGGRGCCVERGEKGALHARTCRQSSREPCARTVSRGQQAPALAPGNIGTLTPRRSTLKQSRREAMNPRLEGMTQISVNVRVKKLN